MISAISTSSAGVTNALRRFDEAAERVASPDLMAEPAAAMTDILSARIDVALNTATLKATSETEKRLLDILV